VVRVAGGDGCRRCHSLAANETPVLDLPRLVLCVIGGAIATIILINASIPVIT
jgi:hypothetical protein